MADISPATSTLPMRYRVGRTLLIAGNLLMVATLFMPWLELETSFCESGPRCHYHYGPWFLIQPGVPGMSFLSLANPFLLILVCAIAILACSIFFLTRGEPKAHSYPLGILFLLTFASFFITIYIMNLLTIGLAFDYPFFHTQVGYGSFVALGGFTAMFVGVLLIWPTH